MGKTKKQKSEKEETIPDNQSSSSKSVHQRIRKKSYDFDVKKKILSTLYLQNVVLNFDKFQHGELTSDSFRRYGENIITEKLKTFDVYAFESATIIRRVTSLRFHPTDPLLFAVGDKNGGLTLSLLNTEEKKISWSGTGPGGSITSISFDPFTPDCLLTSSIDGTVRRRSYGFHKCLVIADTRSVDKWYCSVNASEGTGLVVAGDTGGFLTLVSKDYLPISRHKLHKGKINTVEFSKNRNWLMATASLDRTVKLWDLRKIESTQPLNTLTHNHPINAAYFSQVNGNRIVTTDQFSEVRVYKAPSFSLETLIHHPHRQFQHLTAIRACWHPLADLVVIGRYPDPSWPDYSQGELRTVDVFSGRTGELKAQMYSVSCKGIISLTDFNSTGEVMASGMGQYVAYWRAKVSRDRLKDSEERKKTSDDSSDDDDQPPPNLLPPKPNNKISKTKLKGKV